MTDYWSESLWGRLDDMLARKDTFPKIRKIGLFIFIVSKNAYNCHFFVFLLFFLCLGIGSSMLVCS